MIKAVLIALSSLALTVILGFLIIPLLKRIKAGQPVYKYVETHKSKNGTPTMGGLFFIAAAVIVYFIFCGFSFRLATFAITIGVSFASVGFLDDFIKIKRKQNEGLKPYQKIIFQVTIGLLVGFFAFYNGTTVFYIPFTEITVDLGVFTVPVVAVILIAVTNSVNLTDGLDGLASSVSIAYFVFLSIIILLQTAFMKMPYARVDEYEKLVYLSLALTGALLGFLLFNTGKASVFMGDTGSLALGGFVGGISIFSSNGFLIPILGIMFVLSSISVIVQVLYYKKTKKRVFLMAPLHHHFQLKGYTEWKIAFVYTLITVVAGCLLLIPYM